MIYYLYMKNRFNVGDKVYFVSSVFRIEEASVIRCSGGFCTIKFRSSNGGIRVRESKVFRTKKEAEEQVKINLANRVD